MSKSRSCCNQQFVVTNIDYNMRFISLIVWALLIILAIYYATVIAHLFTNMFGKNVDFKKTLIPFYGWKIWFDNF